MGTVQIDGSTPKLTIGNATAEDATILFDGNAQDFYIALDDSADDLLIGKGSTVGTTPAIAIDENLKVNIPVTTASTSASTGSLTTGGGAGIGADLYVGDDVYLITDSAVLGFGADKDTTLTHTDGTGLTLNSTNKLCFNDASQFVQGSSNAILALGATDEIDLTATTVDLNGTLDVSGNSQFSGTITVGVNDTGKDVKFFGATSGAYMLWDESTDDLVLAGAANLYLYDAGGGEKLSSDGTDLTINSGNDIFLTATTDINVPADVGMTFGAQGEKIEGDGTDLTISSSGVLNLGAGGNNHVIISDSEPHIKFTATGTADGVQFDHGTASALTSMSLIGGEGKGGFLYLSTDQEDDNDDKWVNSKGNVNVSGGGASANLYWSQYSSGSWDHEMRLAQDGILTAEGAMNASTTIDYAE